MSKEVVGTKKIISEVFELEVLAIGTSEKLSLLSKLQALLRGALTKKDTLEENMSDLTQAKSEIWGGWDKLANRNWAAAEQHVIDAEEIIIKIGIVEDLIDADKVDFNPSRVFRSPEGPGE